MIASLIRTVYFLRLKAENTAVTKASHGVVYFFKIRFFFVTSMDLKKKSQFFF